MKAWVTSFASNSSVVALFLAVLSLLPTVAVAQSTYYVDADAAGANDGSTWADAFTTLTAAITAATTDGDVILVAAATYTEDLPDMGLYAVSLYGGFAGAGTEVLADRDPSANLTTLTRVTPGSMFLINNAAPAAAIHIEGFTVSGVSGTNGAGIFLSTPRTLSVRDMIFDGNTASSFGGAINAASSGATVTIDNTVFTDNSAPNGGALFIRYAASTVTIDGSRFEGNQATTGSGGAIFADGTVVTTISDSEFESNTAAAFFGGAFSGDAALTLSTSRFSGNSAIGGGAMHFVGAAAATIVNSIFDQNVAVGAEAGAIYLASGTLGVDHSTFYQNATDQVSGGAIHDAAAGATVTNSIFDDNTAAAAGNDSYDVDSASNNFYDSEGVAGSGSGNQEGASPEFTDAPNGDFTLLVTSYALNLGSTGLATDIDGNSRDSDPDAGAHEAGFEFDYGDLPASGPDYSAVTTAAGAARHLIGGPVLGAIVDAEANGQPTAAADGDGADEDGVAFSTLISGTTVDRQGSVQIYLSGASVAYANIWIDWTDGTGGVADGDFNSTVGTEGDLQLVDQPLSAGDNVIGFDIPSTVLAGTVYARVRVTSSTGTSATSGFLGHFADGEVQDYQLTVYDEATPPATVAVATGPGGASISYDGGTGIITVNDPNGDPIYVGPVGASGISVAGSIGNDTFTFDGDIDGDVTVAVDGGSGGTDAIVLEDPAAVTEVTQTYTSETSGSIVMVGANTHTITYTNLDPIVDNTTAATKTFIFSPNPVTIGSSTITLNADGDGATDNGYSWIDCEDCGEATSFKNPTTTLNITSSGDADIINLGLLDTSGATLPTVAVNVTSGAGADQFNVTPAPGASGYAITLDGGTPSGTCPADGLIIDTSGGAVVSSYGTPPTGPVEFSSTHQDIDYSAIESAGNANVAISLSASTLYSTDVLDAAIGNDFQITVINNGPDTANCVTVTLDPALADYIVGPATTSGPGSFLDPVWSVGALAPGVSATLSIEGFVATNVDREVTFTANVIEDSATEDNVATAEVTIGFIFPAKAHVNQAVYVTQELEVNGTTYNAFDQLLVGLYQGSPGKDGAVWCKLPTLVDTDNNEATTGDNLWPPLPLTSAAMPNLWRPCATGLPFPLHVNDFYLDDQGTATPDDDVLWLAVWGYAGLYKSENLGQSWEEAWPQLGPGDPSQSAFWTNVYAITEDAADILYISANNGQIYRSLDSGGIWQHLGSLPHSSADTPWSLTAHPTLAGTIYAGLFGKGVYVSTDFGLTWAPLDDPGTAGTDENEALLDTDMSGDFAGHVFDLKFSPDGDYLFAGTGYGTWRADLTAGATDFTGTWEFLGPVVTLDAVPAVVCTLVSVDPACVFPEVRSLAFNDTVADTDDNLFVSAWGFGAFVNEDPNLASAFTELTLRQDNVTFLAISPNGELALGSDDGSFATMAMPAATSTASEPEGGVRELPTAYSLEQNYPNPFNPVTTIAFAAPETAQMRLAVYDVLGREVAVLVNGVVEAGQHEIQFDAGNLPSGTYLYRLATEGRVETRMLTLMK